MKENKSQFRKGALCGALAVLIIVGAVFGARTAVDYFAGEKTVVGKQDENKFEEIQKLIDQYYLHSDELDKSDLEEGIYAGYVNKIGDPYSVYYDAASAKALEESTAGEYGGIGAVMQQDPDSGTITITEVYEDSPAAKGGMKDGDILYKVEGEEVTGISLNDVVEEVKGEEGTAVTVSVLRGEEQQEIEMTLTREKVETHTVDFVMLDGNVGYTQVSEFDTVTYKQFSDALEELENQGMEGLIMDLRNNPGGKLDTVCQMLDLLLPEGLIVYTEDKNGDKQEITSDAEHEFDKPMAVLVNGNSASASEIFAGAIQDYKKGTIVGTTTYGKGVVQQIFDLKDGTKVKLTIAEYFTPNGRNIDGTGITPDEVIEYVYDEENPEVDNQLNKAYEIVKEKI